MKITVLTIFAILSIVCFGDRANAQEMSTPALKTRRNSINLYGGVVEYNINYERNIFQLPKSYTNIRFGIGGEAAYMKGYYINPTLVHLFGIKNSHLELNIGIKIEIGPHVEGTSLVLPDIFAGYRYEKPEGRFIFRTGLNAISVYNIGIGVKF